MQSAILLGSFRDWRRKGKIIVNSKKGLFFICLLTNPLWLFAEQQEVHQYTAKEKIRFAPSTQAAFDRSGEMVKHRVLADGSLMAEHNGSVGHVMVARRGPNGKIETFCTSHEEGAKAFMAGESGTASIASLNSAESGR